MRKDKVIIIIISILGVLFLGMGITLLYYYEMIKIKSVEIVDYDKQNDKVSIDVYIENKLPINIYCAISKEQDIEKLEFIKANNNVCSFNEVYDDYYIFLKYNKEVKEYVNINDVTDKVLEFSVDKNCYDITKGLDTKISYVLKMYGNCDISWDSFDDSVLKIEDDTLIGIKNGKTKVVGKALDKEVCFDVNVKALTVEMPKHFDYDKSYLTCNRYSSKEAKDLDKLLFKRIEEAGGYKTRAAVVAAARFLTLEFPYRIDYFFENGRVNSSGANYADGEGRYYHVGLYLNKDKFSSIKYTFAGPVIWGCPLMNYEDYGWKYISGRPNSNGLDCSGFVAWALLNGGYDVGDRGAGETPDSDFQMTDLGKRVNVTKELIDSNVVKAGDLINWWGHIGVIVGIDNDTYYVAESLDFYDGLVVKEYKKEVTSDEKKAIDKLLNYDTIASRYNPVLADPVKNEFNRYYTDDDLKNYFKVWFTQLKKHPLVYVEATIANTYGYIYPVETNWYVHIKGKKIINNYGFDYHFNKKLRPLRMVLGGFAIAFPYIPFIGLLINIGFNTWILLFMLSYLFYRKKYKDIIILIPSFLILLVCFVSPANTYFRYALPNVFALPLMLLMFDKIISKKDK